MISTDNTIGGKWMEIIASKSQEVNKERLHDSRIKQMENVFSLSLDLMVVVERNGKIQLINPAWEKILGYKQEEILNTNGYHFIHPEDRDGLSKAIRELGLNGQLQNYCDRMITKQGEVRAFEWNVRVVDGVIYATGRDITEWQALMKQLNDEKDKFQNVIEGTKAGIWELDLETEQFSFNERWANIIGYELHELDPVTRNTMCEYIHPDDVDKVELRLEQVLHNPRLDFEVEYRLKHRDGSWIWVEDKGKIMDYEGDQPKRMFGLHTDISVRKKAEEDVLYLSYHDLLTGLYNRRFLDEEMRRLDTPRNYPISILMGDVNRLKFVNDTFGHHKGDELLIKAAQAIRESCRPDDIICRWGGDEFVVLLPKTEGKDADAISQRISRQMLKHEVNSLKFTISFGYATKERQDESMESILIRAEKGMYANKIRDNENDSQDIIENITHTLYAKFPSEEEHAKRVSALSETLAMLAGLDDNTAHKAAVAGLLHDIGKVAIDSEILTKGSQLSQAEQALVRQHPLVGSKIIGNNEEMNDIRQAILTHHERLDGKGYPAGRTNENIPIIARILTIVEGYDSMTHSNSYREALSQEKAIAELRANSGSQFDPKLTELFIDYLTNLKTQE